MLCRPPVLRPVESAGPADVDDPGRPVETALGLEEDAVYRQAEGGASRIL